LVRIGISKIGTKRKLKPKYLFIFKL